MEAALVLASMHDATVRMVDTGMMDTWNRDINRLVVAVSHGRQRVLRL